MERIKHKGKIRPKYDKYVTAQPPWSERRLWWLQKVVDETARAAKYGFARGMIVNVGGFYKTNTRERTAYELRRLISEGLLVLSNQKQYRWGAGRGHSKSYRWINITEAGKKLLGV